MKSNLIIGKNSFVGKSLSKSKKGIYISYKDIDDIDFKDFKNIYLLSSPKNYRKKKELNFSFEKKVLNKLSNQKLIFFSTSKIYPNRINCSEDLNPSPQNFYAENKLKVEKLFTKEYEKSIILRFSNIFDVKTLNKKNFLGLLNSNYFDKGKIIFDINLKSKKDFISIKSIKKILKKIENNLNNGIYNIGSQTGYTINKIIKFYFGEKIMKLTPVNQKQKIVSQTLSIKKINKLLKLSKYNFHYETKNQLLICKKYFS